MGLTNFLFKKRTEVDKKTLFSPALSSGEKKNLWDQGSSLNSLCYNVFSHQDSITLLTFFFSPPSFLIACLSFPAIVGWGKVTIILVCFVIREWYICQSVDISYSQTTFRVLWTEVEPTASRTVAGRSHHLFIYYLYTSSTRRILLILPCLTSKIFQAI